MKNLFTISIFGLVVVMTSLLGCSKIDNIIDPQSDLPDITGFSITKTSSFIQGISSRIYIQAPKIGSGNFTVHYDLTGVNAASGLTADVTLATGVGTFSTPTLNNIGSTSITITSITNSSGKTSNISSRNTKAINVGFLTFTRNGTVFESDEVEASVSAYSLDIRATKWDPLTTVYLSVYDYANAPTIVDFNPSTIGGGGSYSTTNLYESAVYGTISVNSTTPLITGSFSFMTDDSVHFTSGRFTATAP